MHIVSVDMLLCAYYVSGTYCDVREIVNDMMLIVHVMSVGHSVSCMNRGLDTVGVMC